MNQRTDRRTRTNAAPALRIATLAAALMAASVCNASAAATVDATTAEAVARETLIDALAPALAVRGATAVVTVSAPDARQAHPPCDRLTAYLPPGARLAGKTVVAVRCSDGANWQAFLSAEVRVEAPVWQTTRALRAGEPIGNGDVAMASAPMTSTDLDVAMAAARSGSANDGHVTASRGLASLDGRMPAPLGRIAQRPVAMGRALTASDVRDEGRINAGDAVRVLYAGDGFSVSSEGRSVGAGDPGTNILIRLASGALVNGTLRADHLVELPR